MPGMLTSPGLELLEAFASRLAAEPAIPSRRTLPISLETPEGGILDLLERCAEAHVSDTHTKTLVLWARALPHVLHPPPASIPTADPIARRTGNRQLLRKEKKPRRQIHPIHADQRPKFGLDRNILEVPAR
jgi:hypothetical protein